MSTEYNKVPVIEQIDAQKMVLNIDGSATEIGRRLPEFRAFMHQNQAGSFQFADKIYNIAHIDEANFEVATSKRIFNELLVRNLIETHHNEEDIRAFLSDISIADREHWETNRKYLQQAQSILENKLVWIIGNEVRRLFSIGNEKNTPSNARVEAYIQHCFSTTRLAFQVVCSLLLSQLWDLKKSGFNEKIQAESVDRFFHTHRQLKLSEWRTLLFDLIRLFRAHHLDLPLLDLNSSTVSGILKTDGAFLNACESIENLESLNDVNEVYGLAHCHTAEMALGEILAAFPFFMSSRLVSMKKVEYEETRNCKPRYIKDFSILEKKDSRNLSRILKYDNNASLTYALFLSCGDDKINLFPFFLDYNTLTNDQDFQIFAYECREGKGGLRYYSLKKESFESIFYRGIQADRYEYSSEEKKNETLTSIRMDLVINQFKDAMNTILDLNELFESQAQSNNKVVDNI